MAVNLDRAKQQNDQITRIADGMPATIRDYALRGDKPFLVIDHELADDVAGEYTEMELHAKYKNALRTLDLVIGWYAYPNDVYFTMNFAAGAEVPNSYTNPETQEVAHLLDKKEVHFEEQVATAAETTQ